MAGLDGVAVCKMALHLRICHLFQLRLPALTQVEVSVFIKRSMVNARGDSVIVFCRLQLDTADMVSNQMVARRLAQATRLIDEYGEIVHGVRLLLLRSSSMRSLAKEALFGAMRYDACAGNLAV